MRPSNSSGILTRKWITKSRPDDHNTYNNQQKKRTCKIVDFPAITDHWVKLKECEKRDKYLDLAREWKTVENESEVYNNCNWCSWYNHQRIGGFGNNRTDGDCPNYRIIEINQNTEMSPGDLRRLVVIQTPRVNYQLMQVWKTRIGVNNNHVLYCENRRKLKDKTNS